MIAGMSVSTFLLVLAFLFFVGSVLGWGCEVLFRRFFSAKKWINPGFLTGPYLPLYGFGLAFMFLISIIPVNTGHTWADKLILILISGAAMTGIEYIAGIIFIKGMKIKLWDYSDRFLNVQGIICPLFSLIWTLVGALYILFVHSFVTNGVSWFVNHIGFAFFVGIFFGVFAIDLCHSLNLTVKIRRFAKTNKVVISFERFKESIKEGIEKRKKSAEQSDDGEKKEKSSFLFAFKARKNLQGLLNEYLEWTDKRAKLKEEKAAEKNAKK